MTTFHYADGRIERDRLGTLIEFTLFAIVLWSPLWLGWLVFG